jgi:hypothetical protein
MASPLNHFTLYLSKEGNSVEIKNFNQDGATIPEQVEALACRTHQEVLAFLERLSHSDTRNQLNFYHHHNTSYDGHMGTWPKGVAHPCTLESQIDFVRYKIGETTHGVRHEPESFCVIQ